MNRELLDSLRARYAAGEKVTRLAREAGIPWQRLWGMLNSGSHGRQLKQTRQEQEGQQQQRYHRDRLHREQDREQQNTRGEGEATPHNPIIRDCDGIARMEFGSVGEAVIDSMTDYAQNSHNRAFIAGRMAEHLSGSDRWGNYFTREKLLAVLNAPPQHLVEAVDSMRRQMVEEIAPPSTPRRRIRRGQEWGDEIDSDRWLVRDLCPWDRNVREQQPKRIVTIGVNLTVHSGQRAEDLLYRGAAATALADILTQRGLNVEIVAFWSLSNLSNKVDRAVARYIVKRADMPLDLGAVTTALCEIAFARLVALYGLARHVPGVLNEGLGICEDLPWSDRKGFDYIVERNVTTRGQAEAWTRGAVAVSEREVSHV